MCLKSIIAVTVLMVSGCLSRQPMLQDDGGILALPLVGSMHSIPDDLQSQLDSEKGTGIRRKWLRDGESLNIDTEESDPSTSPTSAAPTGSPDSTGLVGGLLDMKQLMSLNLWTNHRTSQAKPRRKDMKEDRLMELLGSDFQSAWMRPSEGGDNQMFLREERPAVRALRQLMKNESVLTDLGLPSNLPPEIQEIVTSWLVKRATCPVRFVWADLGPFFWPRFLRRGECGKGDGDVNSDGDVTDTGSSSNMPSYDEDEQGDEYGGSLGSKNVTVTYISGSCSWPPGMKCVPGAVRTLHILRWHCRLRQRRRNYNAILNGRGRRFHHRAGAKKKDREVGEREPRFSKYRCSWIKVPYSVPEDCVCAV